MREREPSPERAAFRDESDGREIDYARLVAEVEGKIGEGYEVFGLVGHSASGKTHFLQALTYLLDRHGVGGEKASIEFHRAGTPGQTPAVVKDYIYTGPADERWILLDVGGELYARLRDNDWRTSLETSVQLSDWLRRCQGLFCFLHLQRGHFGVMPPEADLIAADDPDRRRRIEKEQEKAREAKQEIQFFKSFLLFLRLLRAAEREGEDAAAVIERCRRADSLSEALRAHERTPPLLDVPVMFFFTQADAYLRDGFELRPGLHLDPRRLPLPANVFAARYLPSLFGAVASQAKRFKFDFLQSYEEHVLDRRDERGEPVAETYFHAPDDPDLLLSAGLAPALDFVLANRPSGRRDGPLGGLLPEIDTRRSLRLHRLLHPRTWRGVPASLLRVPDERPPDEPAAETADPAGEPSA